jgi:hypothetical protein
VTAWGRPIKGLQAGIRCPAAKQVIASGEVVELELIVRNVSKETMTLTHAEPSMFLGAAKDGTLELSWLCLGNNHQYTRVLSPGAEFVVGRVSVRHVRPMWPAQGGPLPVELSPGKYQVGADDVLVPPFDRLLEWNSAPNPRLGTGYLDIELLQRTK